MRRLILISLILSLLMPLMSATAQTAPCSPQLIESANDLIDQARNALSVGDTITADALLSAAQNLLLPCYDLPYITPTATFITPTPYASPTAPSSDIPTVFNSDNVVDTVITTLGIFNDDVRGVDFSPNGLYALASSFDGNLYLYDVATYEQVRVFSGHTDWVFNADFTRDGRLLASASADDTVRVWDVASATTIAILDAHTENVTNVAFSPDASLLVSTGQDNLVIVWDTDTWQPLRTLYGHSDWVWDVSFSPDGSFFVTVSSDNSAIIWNTADFYEVGYLVGHDDIIISVEYSPDGDYILTGSHDGRAILWDTISLMPVRAYMGIPSAVMDVAFSHDMRYIASASFGGYVYVWTLDGTPIADHAGHTSTGVWAVQFSPDGTLLLSGADDGGMLLHARD